MTCWAISRHGKGSSHWCGVIDRQFLYLKSGPVPHSQFPQNAYIYLKLEPKHHKQLSGFPVLGCITPPVVPRRKYCIIILSQTLILMEYCVFLEYHDVIQVAR